MTTTTPTTAGSAAGAAGRRVVGQRKRTGNERARSFAWHASLLIVLLIVLYPAFWILTASVKPNADIITDISPIPSAITWEHFASAFDGLAGVPLWRFFWNSTLIAGLSVLGTVMSCSITAYALGRLVEAHDMPLVRDIVRRSAADGYRFETLITHIVQSDAFLKAKVPEAKAAGKLQAAVVD